MTTMSTYSMDYIYNHRILNYWWHFTTITWSAVHQLFRSPTFFRTTPMLTGSMDVQSVCILDPVRDRVKRQVTAFAHTMTFSDEKSITGGK